MPIETYRNVIIGSGEGGKYLAWHLAAQGEQTIVVERKLIGGSCPNTNCLPSKNEIWSAKVADLMHHAAQFGSDVKPVPVDIRVVRQRKRAMVDGLIKVHLEKYRATGAELVMGHAEFTAPLTVQVKLIDGGTRSIVAERLFLNLGTKASTPPVPGLAEAQPMTHVEMLELDTLPEHLVVIGGGYIGLEFAQAYRRFGSRVTILQHGPQLLAGQDADVALEVLKLMVDEGIHVITSCELLSVAGTSGQRVTLTIRTEAGEQTIAASHILVATGRTPNTSGIGLEKLSVNLDARGFLQVNDRLECTAANVWGIGECAGTPQFTHASYDDYRVIRDNLAGKNRSIRDRLMPSCLYTDPAVAHIGLTESEARMRGIAVRVAKIPMAAVLRSRTIDETRGFMKALLDPITDRILGFTMVGPEAGEVMAVVQMAMLMNQPFVFLRDAILAHPTMAEGLNVLFSAIKPASAV